MRGLCRPPGLIFLPQKHLTGGSECRIPSPLQMENSDVTRARRPQRNIVTRAFTPHPSDAFKTLAEATHSYSAPALKKRGRFFLRLLIINRSTFASRNTASPVTGTSIRPLAGVAFVQLISPLLVHYSRRIVERATLLKGIRGDDLISRDWCQTNTGNVFPPVEPFYTCKRACAPLPSTTSFGLKITKYALPRPTAQTPWTCVNTSLLMLKMLCCFSFPAHRTLNVPPGTENGSSEWCQRRTISGSTKNLSNQGSLKNHFLEEFFKEPIKVPQRTFKKIVL